MPLDLVSVVFLLTLIKKMTNVVVAQVLGASDVNAAVAAALLDAGQPLSQISVTSSDSGGAGRKRQVRSFDIEIRPANSVAGGVSALEIANSMLTRAEQQNIVVSGVQMQAPNTPEVWLFSSICVHTIHWLVRELDHC